MIQILLERLNRALECGAQKARFDTRFSVRGVVADRFDITALTLLSYLIVSPSLFANDWIYTVRPGDTLWHLSERYLKDVSYYRQVQNHNNIRSPRALDPGTQLRIPIAWLKLEPEPVQVLHVRGQVEVIRAADGSNQPLRVGDILRIGDQIQTGEDSSASVQFADGSMLAVKSNTLLSFNTLKVYGRTGMVDTRLRLQRGNVENQVQPFRGPGSRYEIHTPAAVTAVRGTRFRIDAEQAQPIMRAEVEAGEVTVSGAGVTRVVPAGYGTIAEAGKPPEPPIELLAAADLTGLPVRIARLPFMFVWPPVADAKAYRLQVWRENDLSALLVEAKTQKPVFELARLSVGKYSLRIRAIDEFDLEGYNAEHRFSVVTRAKPPKLVSPGDGDKLAETRPPLQWEGIQDAHGYYIQIATDPYFHKHMIAQDLPTTETYQPNFEFTSGYYYWRVATRNAQGELGAFAKAHAFTIEPTPATTPHEGGEITAARPPVLHPPGLYEDRLDFTWTEAFFNADRWKYHFQIAYEPEFNHVLVDTLASERRLSLPLPPPGRYYYRLRSFDAADRAGLFSAIHWVDIPLLNRNPRLDTQP